MCLEIGRSSCDQHRLRAIISRLQPNFDDDQNFGACCRGRVFTPDLAIVQDVIFLHFKRRMFRIEQNIQLFNKFLLIEFLDQHGTHRRLWRGQNNARPDFGQTEDFTWLAF